jgi:hypothetical protein
LRRKDHVCPASGEHLATQEVEPDSLYWDSGWIPRPDFQEAVLTAAQQPRWVIDGNYSGAGDGLVRYSTEFHRSAP